MLQWHTGHDFLECIPHHLDKGRVKLMHVVNSLAETLIRPTQGDQLSALAYLRIPVAKVFPTALLTWTLGA
jgi:hypothetical protein